MMRNGKGGADGWAAAAAPIAGSIRQLLSNARWALNLTWTSNPGLTGRLIGSYLLQSAIPAAQALATRGVIDVAVAQLRSRSTALRPMVAWLIFAFVATLADGLNRLSLNLTMRRLEDDLNLELNSMILTHAGKLDVSLSRIRRHRDILLPGQTESGRQPGALRRQLAGGVFESAPDRFAARDRGRDQTAGAGRDCSGGDPLSAFPMEADPQPLRTGALAGDQKRRWTQYFVTGLTDSAAVPEAKILDLAPLMIQKFGTADDKFAIRTIACCCNRFGPPRCFRASPAPRSMRFSRPASRFGCEEAPRPWAILRSSAQLPRACAPPLKPRSAQPRIYSSRC